MKIFILEDDPNRVSWFKENLDCKNLDITEFVEEAIELLNNNTYDAVFLDHDLGGTYYAPSDEKSGYAVAELIAENITYKPIIVIHSMNHAGGTRMYGVLRDAGFNPVMSPFTCLMGNY